MLWDEDQKLGTSGVLLKMKPVCYYFMTVFPVPEHCCDNSVVDGSAFLGRNIFFLLIQHLPCVNFLFAKCFFYLSFLFIYFEKVLLA